MNLAELSNYRIVPKSDFSLIKMCVVALVCNFSPRCDFSEVKLQKRGCKKGLRMTAALLHCASFFSDFWCHDCPSLKLKNKTSNFHFSADSKQNHQGIARLFSFEQSPKWAWDSRAPRQKNWGSRAPLLYSKAQFSPNRYVCPGSSEEKTLGSGLHGKNFGAPGFQGYTPLIPRLNDFVNLLNRYNTYLYTVLLLNFRDFFDLRKEIQILSP